jgi:type III secretion protein V
LRALTHVLQRLLAERVGLTPLRPVLEAIAAEGAGSAGAAALVERVRGRLARRIVAAHAFEGALSAHAIDPMIEDALRDAIQGQGDDAYLALRPDLAAEIVAGIRQALDRSRGRRPVLLTQADVRRWLRGLIEHELAEVAVLSYSELPPDAVVERLAPVRVGMAR